MAEKIAFSDLVAKVQNKNINRKEIGKYFAVDEAKSSSFAPALTLDRSTVDTAGAERSAKLAAPALAAEASHAAKSNRAKAAGAAAQPSIVAEGDSWFNLPDIVYPDTIIDILQADHAIANLAMYGDELEEMVLRAEYMPLLATGNIKFLLFSGGGNDVIGGGALSSCLNLYDVHHTDPKQAAYYINTQFDAVLDRVEKLYRRVSAQVRTIAPNTSIVVHGYDYAIPRNEGPHLGKAMRDRGLDPAWDGALCNAIIRLMIDRFNDRLAKLPSENIVYVDLRGTAGKAGWFDELHPSSAAAGRMAKKLTKVLN
jgi:lysophospholipase L1-like esterase